MTTEFLINVHTFLKFSFRLNSMHLGCRVCLLVWDLDSPGESSDCFFVFSLYMLKKVRIKFNYDLYEAIKEIEDVDIVVYGMGGMIVLSTENGNIRAKYKPDSLDKRQEVEGLHTPGMLFMYVPEILLEIYSDLERI